MINYFKSHRSNLLKIFYVLITFLICKALTFLAPLKIFDLIESANEYGLFEFNLNLAQTLSAVFGVGLTGSYGYFITKKELVSYKPIFHFHFILISSILIVISLAFPHITNNTIFQSIVLANVFANQIFISGYLKLNNKTLFSIIIDTGVYLLMGVFIMSAIIEHDYFNTQFWFFSCFLYLILIQLFFHLPKLKGFNQIEANVYKEVYLFGIIAAISGPLLFLITASTRLYIEYFLDLGSVATYSVIFRILSIILIVSRVSSILLYKRMFVNTHSYLDKNYSIILVFVFLSSVLCFFLIPMALEYFDEKYLMLIQNNPLIYKLSYLQIYLWINISLFEVLFLRENLLKKFLLITSIVTTLLFISLITFDYFEETSIVTILFTNVFALLLLLKLQFFYLNKYVYFYRYTFYTTLFSIILLTFLCYA
mgnify:CR=1 FL=1|tara:strand:- start:1476 stop:2750 length:1275 start_codon:yes stop_codon:yes gene_type:complete